MIRFFSKIRQKLFFGHSPGKYLLYAIGEILLVVIGILIALQINNQNDLRKDRIKEIQYLENIKTDLNINLLEMDRYLDIRTENIEGAARIIEHFEGKPITDYSAFNADGVKIYNWQKFYMNNNTFQELVNSGNLALISNESIKNMLLDIESLYKTMKSEEDHYRFDTEKLLYEPLYEMMDLRPMVSNFEFHASNGSSGEDVTLTSEYFADFLKNRKVKNGFVMTILEFTLMNEQMRGIKEMTEDLILLLDQEIQKG